MGLAGCAKQQFALLQRWRPRRVLLPRRAAVLLPSHRAVNSRRVKSGNADRCRLAGAAGRGQSGQSVWLLDWPRLLIAADADSSVAPNDADNKVCKWAGPKSQTSRGIIDSPSKKVEASLATASAALNIGRPGRRPPPAHKSAGCAEQPKGRPHKRSAKTEAEEKKKAAKNMTFLPCPIALQSVWCSREH